MGNNSRLNRMRHFLSTMDYPGKDLAVVGAPDPLIVGQAHRVIHRADPIPGPASAGVDQADNIGKATRAAESVKSVATDTMRRCGEAEACGLALIPQRA